MPKRTKSRIILKLIVVAGVFFLVTLSFGCGRAGQRSSPRNDRVVKDDLGRSLELPERVDRAISLAPSLTEMAFAAGAGDRLAGVTSYCNYPESAKSIQKVGDTQTPNVESIVALKPQVVLVSTASQLEAFLDVLEQQGIEVFVMDVKGIDDVPKGLRLLGDLFGTDEIANSVATSIEQRALATTERTTGRGPVRVFVQISKEPLFTIGRESFLTEVVRRAGGVSVTKDVATAYPKLSKETALALDPDTIILSDSDDNKEPNAVFKNSRAMKNGRVYRVNADIISRPGPRLVDAMEEIARMLHPELTEAK